MNKQWAGSACQSFEIIYMGKHLAKIEGSVTVGNVYQEINITVTWATLACTCMRKNLICRKCGSSFNTNN